MPKKKIRNIRTEEFVTDGDQADTVIFDVETEEKDITGVMFFEGDYERATVHRRGPARYHGKAIDPGFVGEYRGTDIDESLIKADFGGGSFKVTAYDLKGKYVGSKVVSIVGPPSELAGKNDKQVSGEDSLRHEMLRDQMAALRDELRESKRGTTFESLLDNPVGLAALITSIGSLFQRKEDPRLSAIERSIDKITDMKSNTPPIESFLSYMKPFQTAQVDMMQTLMDAKVEVLVNSQGSNEWVTFFRELTHGPWGEKIGEAIDGLKKLGEQRTAQVEERPVTTPQDVPRVQEVPPLPGIAGEWFDAQFLPRLVMAIRHDVTPEDFAATALEHNLVKDPFIDYLFEDYLANVEIQGESNSIKAFIGQLNLPKEMDEALRTDYVVEWLGKAFDSIIALVSDDTPEVDEQSIADIEGAEVEGEAVLPGSTLDIESEVKEVPDMDSKAGTTDAETDFVTADVGEKSKKTTEAPFVSDKDLIVNAVPDADD